MKLFFHGAARSVTGSRHMVETPGCRLLLDCGLFQGRREEALRQNLDLGFDPKSIGAVLLSHAHVDHSGTLQVLPKHGFSGKVYLTRATADLTELMLEDSARVQVSDCGYVNKKEQRRGKACVRPLYNTMTSVSLSADSRAHGTETCSRSPHASRHPFTTQAISWDRRPFG